MSFELSPCIGLTIPQPNLMIERYTQLLELTPKPSIDGLKLASDTLQFFVDPGQRQPPILELQTDNLEEARPLVRAFGCEELIWHGEGELNLICDPFGISWNILQADPNPEWPELPVTNSLILPKIGLHLHESMKAAQFYADFLHQNATKTPSGWTIDSNHIRLVIEPGLPHGPVFYLDPNNAADPQPLREFFSEKSTQTDEFGITWKLNPKPHSDRAVISG